MRLNLNRARSYLLTVCQKRSVSHIPKLLVSNAVWAPLLECANHSVSAQRGRGDDALVNVVAYLQETFIYAFRTMKHNAPEDILTELDNSLKSYAT